ncbi:MAG: AAA family ATPase [Caldilineaceae bacterium]
MFHQLVPSFILQKYAQREHQGTLRAITLLIDVSGFTHLTRTLFPYGDEGVEEIAALLDRVFPPLIEIIATHGGFVSSFAGDAIYALFPFSSPEQENGYEAVPYLLWQIQSQMAKLRRSVTRFGEVSFRLTAAMAEGDVYWKIWLDHKRTRGQRAAYLFYGPAFDALHPLKQQMAADQIILTGLLYAKLQALPMEHSSLFAARMLSTDVYLYIPPNAQSRPTPSCSEDTQRGRTVTSHAPVPSLIRGGLGRGDSVATLPQSYSEPYNAVVSQFVRRSELDLGDFFPEELLLRSVRGEFRTVITIFAQLPQIPHQPEDAPLLSTLFRLLDEFGGYLCRVDQADTESSGMRLLCFWGAPIGQEASLQRALDFLLALRSALSVPLRAGITIGSVFAGFIGVAPSEEYTCYGDSVNLAARLMTAAGWGEIYSDLTTERQSQAGFQFQERQTPLVAKGFAQPQRVFLLQRHHPRPMRSLYSGALIGRSHELARLHTAVALLWQHQFGGILLIEGEAGIGKSRLVQAFAEQLATAVVAPQWLFCRADEHQQRGLEPFRYGLRSYFAQSGAEDKTHNRASFDQKLDALVQVTPDPTLAADLQWGRSFLGALLDLHWQDGLYEQVEPSLRANNVRKALKVWIKAESLRQPLILHIDDAQWLDEDSLAFLQQLIHNVDTFPFLVLLSSRPGQRSLHSLHPLMVLTLPTLGREEIRTVASAWLTAPVDPNLFALLADKAEGNPFFIEQWLRYLQENELLEQIDNGVYTARTETIQLPANLRSLMTARLDHLPLAVKELVQVASVLGQEFDLSLLSLMLDDEPVVVEQETVMVLLQLGIWSPLTDSQPGKYRFHHVLLHETAYSMQLYTRRRMLHRRAATAIQSRYTNALALHWGTLVYHFQQAGEVEQEKVYAQLAGEYALKNYANEDAVRYLSRALALSTAAEGAASFRLLLAREQANDLLGRRQAQVEDFAALEALQAKLTDCNQIALFHLRQARYARLTNNYPTAIHFAQSTIALAKQADDLVIEAQAHNLWGRTLWQQGDYSEARRQLRVGLALAKQCGLQEEEAQNLYDLAIIDFYQADLTTAEQNFRLAQTAYAVAKNRMGEANCLLMFGAIAYKSGNFSAAQRYLEAGLAMSQAAGWLHGQLFMLAHLGNVFYDVGDYKRAYEYHQQALQRCREVQDREGEAVSLDTLGLIVQHLPGKGNAYDYFEAALAIQNAISDQHGAAYSHTHAGFERLAANQLTAAATHFEQALALRLALHEDLSAIDDMAGLVLVAYHQCETVSASGQALEMLNRLAISGIEGLENPVMVYLICWQALSTQPSTKEEADQVLAAAYQLIQSRSAAIEDETLRRSYLENVPVNWRVIQLWQSKQMGIL